MTTKTTLLNNEDVNIQLAILKDVASTLGYFLVEIKDKPPTNCSQCG